LHHGRHRGQHGPSGSAFAGVAAQGAAIYISGAPLVTLSSVAVTNVSSAAGGAALCVAARYRIGYAAALAAVTPVFFAAPAEAALAAYEEAAEEFAAAAAEAGEEMEWSEGGGSGAPWPRGTSR
jgi:hypothetical protein